MKARTGVNRYPLSPATTIPQRRVRSISGRKSLVQRSFAPLSESPGSVYLAGVGLGIGCGGLVVVLLLGMLSL
jgi:hypothetical protein